MSDKFGTMLETGAVIGRDYSVLHWHEPRVRSSVFLPDSQDLWGVLWENRGQLVGFAHSHPGGGIPHPSYEDLTTFAAVEAALGCRLRWWIVSDDAVVVVMHRGSTIRLDYEVNKIPEPTPDWVYDLRSKSGMLCNEEDNGS